MRPVRGDPVVDGPTFRGVIADADRYRGRVVGRTLVVAGALDPAGWRAFEHDLHDLGGRPGGGPDGRSHACVVDLSEVTLLPSTAVLALRAVVRDSQVAGPALTVVARSGSLARQVLLLHGLAHLTVPPSPLRDDADRA